MFERKKYYSQTDILKEFKISLVEFKKIRDKIPYIEKAVDLGLYTTTAKYYRKEDIIKLHIPLREQK